VRLTKDEFEGWLSHPTTEKFRRYLFDLRATHKEDWALNNIAPNAWDEYRVKCGLLKELCEIDFETIDRFYETETPASEAQ
jgi:hypothetical protein